MSHRGQCIGIDFDNTIVDYGEIFPALARRLGLVGAAFAGGKTELRDALRARGGEADWMRLQAAVYGSGIAQAPAYAGFAEFLEHARAHGAALAIVSHKTELAAADPAGGSLRAAAREWLRAHGISGAKIPEAAIFFEATRADKIARIVELGCSHFIDDLCEVFDDPSFPAGVARIVFAPGGAVTAQAHYQVANSWPNVTRLIFDAG